MKKNIIFFISIFLFISCSNKKLDKLHFDFDKEKKEIKIVEFEPSFKIELPDDRLIKTEITVVNDSLLVVSGISF